MNGIVADVRGAVEVIRELLRDSHTFEGQRGVKASSEKFRMNRREGAPRDVERMFYFQRRGLLPHRIASNLIVNLRDQDPIGSAVKRGAHPLLIYLGACACGHSGI